MAVRFFFGFLRALAIFCSTPDFLVERAAVFLVALLVLFLVVGFFFAGALAVFFTVLLGVLFFVLLRTAGFPVLVEGARLATVDIAAFFVPVAFLAGLFLAAAVFAADFLAAGLAVVLFFTVVLFFAVALFFFTPGAFVFLVVAFALDPVVFVLLFPTGDVLFFEAVVLPLAALEVFFAVVDFFPAALLELLPPLWLPEEVLAFGIVISLLIHCYSISVFLLIW